MFEIQQSFHLASHASIRIQLHGCRSPKGLRFHALCTRKRNSASMNKEMIVIQHTASSINEARTSGMIF
jgi:hypothetical protein